MTKLYALFAFMLLAVTAIAQNTFPASGSTGIGTITPNASSILDITSTTKGILIPRMTTVNRNAIVSPAKGLMIFQTDGVAGFYYYTGFAWKAVTTAASQWITSGNNIYYTKGRVGIGTVNPQQRLHIAGGLRIDTLANGIDSGLLRYDTAGTVYSLKFTGDSSQALRGNGTFGSLNNSYWSLAGNAGTSGANFIGTTDGQPLNFRVNNSLAGLIDPTDFNTFFGGNSPITNGTGNSGFGANALMANQFGYHNTAVGYGSLTSNISGWGNVSMGLNSLYSNVSGNELVAIGEYALFSQNGGSGGNVAVGSNAMYSNTTGYENVATGSSALYSNITGYYNTAIGSSALKSNGAGSQNTAIGHNTLFSNTSGFSNTSVGSASGYFNTTGSDNAFFGVDAGEQNSTGSYNSFFGYSSGAVNISGINNSFFGQGSGFKNTIGHDNTFIGNGSGYKNVSASSNAFVGGNSGFNTTTGAGNTALGMNAMIANATGHSNVAIGINTLYKNTSGSNLVAIGDSALFTQNGGSGENTAVGTKALYANTIGSSNTAMGAGALNLNVNGYNNTAIGTQAQGRNTTGVNNTSIGSNSLTTNVTGSANISIGYLADVNADNYSNSIAIGTYATGTASNQVRIGNNMITSIGGFKAWTNLSDGRFKKNIKENVPGLAFIKKLRPITYTVDVKGLNGYLRQPLTDTQSKNTPSNLKAADVVQDDAIAAQEKVISTGFIAQEVEKTANDLGYVFDGVDAPKNKNDVYGLRYSEFVVPLVKAVQELSLTNDSLKNANQALNNKVDKLQLQNENMQLQNNKMQSQLNNILQKINELTTAQEACCFNASSATGQTTGNGDAPRLEQNAPNPFNNNTIIHYYIPSATINAQMLITNVSGQVLKQYSLTSKGAGQTIVYAGELASGSYFYSLIVDRKKVATKQMVLLQ